MLPPRDLSLVLGVHPTELSFAAVAAFARDLEQAVELEAAAGGEAVPSSDPPPVSLVGVRESSSAFDLAVHPVYAAAAARLLRGLRLAGEAWKAVALPAQELVAKAINRMINAGASVRFDSFNAAVLGAGPFDHDHRPPEVRPDLFVTGPTEYAVEVVRAGGVRPTAYVKVAATGQRLPAAGLHRGLIQDLGRRLYGKAVVAGDATWRVPDWKLVGFVVRRVTDPPEGNPGDSLGELRRLLARATAEAGGLDGFAAAFRDEEGEP